MQFTIRDLCALIVVVGVLLALIAPFLLQTRGPARRTNCANNLHQLGIATLTYVMRSGHFPGYQQTLNVDRSSWPPPNANVGASWVVMLLPMLDQEDIYVRWSDPNLVPVPNNQLVPFLSILHCNSVGPRNTGVATNSYVANAGFFPRVGIDPPPYGAKGDIQANGIRDAFEDAQTAANGIFHDFIYVSNAPRTSPDDFQDGMSNTILFSESRTHYLNSVTWDTINDSTLEQKWFHVMTWLYAHDGDPTLLDNEYQGAPTPVSPDMRINGGLRKSTTPITAETARPSSNHPAGVNIAFTDRHVMFLRDDIDYHVYQQLMTPHGMKSDMPARRYKLNAKDY